MFRFPFVRRAVFLSLAALALMGFFGFIESFLLYHPLRGIEITPADYGVAYQDVAFRAADGTALHGWYVPPAEEKGPVLLWAHGNAGNVSHRSENLALIRRHLGAGAFIFDYRGYGKSEGRPGEAGLYADGRAAYAWLRGRTEPGRIFLFGRSLGAAVMVRLAAEGAEARGLILESPFVSTVEMGKTMFPFLPVSWIVEQKFDSAPLIGKVKMPIFVLHGNADGIVPFEQGGRLFDLAPAPKRFFVIRGAGHNDTYIAGGAKYWEAWAEFLDRPEGE